jgi:porphobilinogen deaminase
VGIYARFDADQLRVSGFVGLPDGSAWLLDEIVGEADEAAGVELARRMLAAGAGDLLRDAEAMA